MSRILNYVIICVILIIGKAWYIIMELTDKQKQESVAAVKEYIIKKKSNEVRHEAFVKTSEKSESYPPVLFVFAETSGNTAKVIVEWDNVCGKDYPTDFLSSNSLFRFYNNALHIDSEDIWGKRISVSITAKQ